MIRYGYARDVHKQWCAVNPRDPARMLCGRRFGFAPVVQPPFAPENLHAVCREAIWGSNAAQVSVPPDVFAEMGVCAVCGGSVDLDADGLVVAHGQHVMRGGQQVVSETACDGAGLKPEVQG